MAKLSQAEIYSACNDVVRVKKDKKKIKIDHPAKNELGPLVRYTENGNRVKVWASHLDNNAWDQAKNFADLSFVHPKGLSLMPDVHFGKDVPVGSVLPTVGVVVPAAVGCDIGCGMIAVKLDLNAKQLPDHLKKIRSVIERKVPISGGGRHKDVPEYILNQWKALEFGHKWLEEKYPHAFRKNAVEQLGTLGTGNHFIEVCLDESQQVWIMIHSGSRGAGSLIGQHFIDKALRRCKDDGSSINGLGWIHENDPMFDDYIKAVEWAQNFAMINRQSMLKATIDAISEVIGRPVEIKEKAINCHHNYIAREKHFNEDVWVTRKGAIRAQKGDLGIIPSAMGQESFIVEGLGEEESWCSCSHGAGRVMSRSAAKGRFTAKDLKQQTLGVECKKDRSVVDEIPSAYKPIKAVMNDQKDLVKVKYKIKAIICVKGV